MTPFQKPYPPLWYGLGRAEATPWAAKNRVNIVGNLPGTGMRHLTDRYRAEWDMLGNDPAELPLMGVGRHVVVAQTEKEALGNRPPRLRQMACQFPEIMDGTRHDAGRPRSFSRTL